MIEDLERLLQPVLRRIGGMVSRVVLRNVDDSHGRQEVQVEGLSKELHPTVEHFQPFGVRGFPPTGVDGIGFAIGGYRNHLVVLGLAPKIAPDPPLQPGDVLFYCGNPKVRARAQADGAYKMQGEDSWFATLDCLDTYQFISMAPGQTVIKVQDKKSGHSSQITITPDQVRIDTASFVHP